MYFFSSKIVKIRKERKCFGCLKVFTKGQKLKFEKYVFEGEFQQNYLCKLCDHTLKNSKNDIYLEEIGPGDIKEFHSWEENKKQSKEFIKMGVIMTKKINMSEKRKLERRLPLWESAYSSAMPSEKKELLFKINNARKLLGMEILIKEEKENKISKDKKPKKEINYEENSNKKKFDPSLLGIKIDPELIVLLHNEYGMKDKEICDKYSITRGAFNSIKSKYIGKRYEPKYTPKFSRNKQLKLTPDLFIEYKNQGLSNNKIAKMYETNHTAVCYFERKYVNKIYYSVNLDKMRKDFHCLLNEIIELLNKGVRVTEMGHLESQEKLTRLKKNYIACRYELKVNNKMTAESYCYYANSGILDKDIAALYGIHPDTVQHHKKNKIKIVYFLK